MILLFISFILTFLSTIFLTRKLIIYLEKAGIVGTDINKLDKRKVAEMGGPSVLAGFIVGIFFYVWGRVFIYGDVTGLIGIFAAISSIMIVSIVGLFDDLSRLFKKNTFKDSFGNVKRLGIKQWQKPFLTLPAAIPLMAIMAGDTSITLPLIGSFNVGILYPLLFIPIGILGASNAINMLAGFNGLEAGMSSVLLAGLGMYAYVNGDILTASFAFIFMVALLAFLIFNWYPAKIFPGDSLTYTIGIVVAVVAILGSMERFALICFIPWFIEFLLKLRSGFKAECFGKIQKDGTLKAPYEKSYSLTHIVMKLGKFKEWQVSLILILFELIVVLFAFLISA